MELHDDKGDAFASATIPSVPTYLPLKFEAQRLIEIQNCLSEAQIFWKLENKSIENNETLGLPHCTSLSWSCIVNYWM